MKAPYEKSIPAFFERQDYIKKLERRSIIARLYLALVERKQKKTLGKQ